jgi:hypothetical protein
MVETKEQRRIRLIEQYSIIRYAQENVYDLESVTYDGEHVADKLISKYPTDTPGSPQTIAQEILRAARKAWEHEIKCADHNEMDFSIFERGFLLGWRASEKQNKGEV